MNKSNTLTDAGQVFLVGAGPGDPDLLTVKALRVIESADIILYDRLVSDEIMALANPTADKIYVGKIKGYHSLPQEQLNQLICQLALQGKTVCRLKGGDPFMFGRGAEELKLLAEHNIKFEVVPGITAAAGCSAYAGIPLTHREYNQSCTFVTGHFKGSHVDHDWQALAKPDQTLVFYMGLTNIEEICANLMQNGLSNSTPVAFIENGTTKHQRVVTTTLSKAVSSVAKEQIVSPALVVVGKVVALRSELTWFDQHEQTNTAYAFEHKVGINAA